MKIVKWLRLAPEPAQSYVDNCLRHGLALSQAAVAVRQEQTAFEYYAGVSIDSIDVEDERLLRFDYGNLWPSVFPGGLATDLCARFPTSQLIVEIPIARPSDPFIQRCINEGDTGIITWQDEVYAHTRLDQGPQHVARVLRHASFHYTAFVISGTAPFPAATIADTAFDAILLDAYDGEGAVGAFQHLR